VSLPADSVCAATPGEVSPPGAAAPLAVDRDGLAWEPGAPSCSATFHVYRGDVAGLALGDDGSCFAPGVSAPELADTTSPSPGGAWFYLVTGVAGGVEGPAGVASDGTVRAPAACP
jgi:hypothetical protein